MAVPQNTALLLMDSSAGFLQSFAPERAPVHAAADRYQCVLSTGCTQIQHQLEESKFNRMTEC